MSQFCSHQRAEQRSHNLPVTTPPQIRRGGAGGARTHDRQIISPKFCSDCRNPMALPYLLSSMNLVTPYQASLYCLKLVLPRTSEDSRGLQLRLQLRPARIHESLARRFHDMNMGISVFSMEALYLIQLRDISHSAVFYCATFGCCVCFPARPACPIVIGMCYRKECIAPRYPDRDIRSPHSPGNVEHEFFCGCLAGCDRSRS
jgi:hypothetical protein